MSTQSSAGGVMGKTIPPSVRGARLNVSPSKTVRPLLSDIMVEAGRSPRIQKILETFGIDTAARDHVFFDKIVAEQGPIWIDLVKGLNLEPQ